MSPAPVPVSAAASTLDPVTLALVQNRLDHISHQMGWVMTRTARSPIFSRATTSPASCPMRAAP